MARLAKIKDITATTKAKKLIRQKIRLDVVLQLLQLASLVYLIFYK